MQWAFACNSQLPAVVCVGGATECCKACCSLGAHADVSLLCGCCCWVLAPVVLDCTTWFVINRKASRVTLGLVILPSTLLRLVLRVPKLFCQLQSGTTHLHCRWGPGTDAAVTNSTAPGTAR